MKKLFFLLSLFMMSACSSDEIPIPKNNAVPENLYQLTITRKTTTPNEAPTMGWNYIQTTYNHKGKPIRKKEILYIDVFDSEITYQTSYTYDNDDRLITEKTDEFYKEESVIQYTYTDFDSIAVKTTTDEFGVVQSTSKHRLFFGFPLLKEAM